MEESRTPLQLVCEHLEFLGYRATSDQLGVQLTHDVQPRFRVFNNVGGIGFLFSFGISKNAAQDDPAGLFGLLNDMNAQSRVARFNVDRETQILWVTAWYPNFYDRVNFGLFFDLLREDILAPRFAFAEGVSKYLTP